MNIDSSSQNSDSIRITKGFVIAVIRWKEWLQIQVFVKHWHLLSILFASVLQFQKVLNAWQNILNFQKEQMLELNIQVSDV